MPAVAAGRLLVSGARRRRAGTEIEIGLWLDRLEAGDYADRIEAVRYLVQLERLDCEIFVISMLAGRPRPRSSRLREAIERLLIGSADQILADLKRRVTKLRMQPKKKFRARRAARGMFCLPLSIGLWRGISTS